MNKKLLPISIIIASLLLSIGLFTTAYTSRYKVVGNKVFDVFRGDYVEKENNTINELLVDESKLKIIKKSNRLDRLSYSIYITVQNNDNVAHTVYARATLLSSNKTPLQTENSSEITIKKGDVKDMEIICTGDTKRYISSYNIEFFEKVK